MSMLRARPVAPEHQLPAVHLQPLIPNFYCRHLLPPSELFMGPTKFNGATAAPQKVSAVGGTSMTGFHQAIGASARTYTSKRRSPLCFALGIAILVGGLVPATRADDSANATDATSSRAARDEAIRLI